MARGRKAHAENVLPMADDGGAGRNLEQRAKARLEELRPEGLETSTRWIFDRLALPLCHPTVNRLTPVNVFMFLQLARAVERHERLIIDIAENGETYSSKTRNGVQVKSRPKVAQLNETFRQIRGLAGEFGMTPQTERGLTGGGQLGFDFPDPDSPEAYLT